MRNSKVDWVVDCLAFKSHFEKAPMTKASIAFINFRAVVTSLITTETFAFVHIGKIMIGASWRARVNRV